MSKHEKLIANMDASEEVEKLHPDALTCLRSWFNGRRQAMRNWPETNAPVFRLKSIPLSVFAAQFEAVRDGDEDERVSGGFS